MCKVTFLSTAIVLIKDKFGNTHEARALLDSGSQSNFISSHYSNKFKFPINQTNQISVSGINAIPIVTNKKIFTEISSKSSSFKTSCNFFIIDSISDALPQNAVPFHCGIYHLKSN